MSKIIEKEYENGKYVGEFFQDLRMGNGKFYFKSGAIFDGEWYFDKISGEGTMTWPNGDKYVGDFDNNHRNGFGTYYYANGDRCEGRYFESMLNGKAIYYYADGKIKYCLFEDDKLIKTFNSKKDMEKYNNPYYYEPNIKPIPTVIEDSTLKLYKYANGSIYMGEMKNNNPNGFGMLIWNDGGFYIGQFVDNRLEGFGILVFEDNTVTLSKWKDSEYYGFGYSIDNDGGCVVGRFKEYECLKEIDFIKNFYTFTPNPDEKVIFKRLFIDDGFFMGETINDVINGFGIFKTKDYTYIGEFKNNKANGIGIRLYNSTHYYIGKFKNNEYTGKGLLIENKEITYKKF